MDVARDVIELFTCKDTDRCREIALKLDQLNTERQAEEQRIVAEIERQLADAPDLSDQFCMIFDGDGWHRGVVGIVASRVVEKTGRPALVIAKDGEEAHGSGRSINALHLLDALESCHDLFTRFGGHSHAVGFALQSASVPELKRRLNLFVRERLQPDDFLPEIKIDLDLPLNSATPRLLDELRALEPFGQGNREPVFSSAGVGLLVPPKIIKEKHIKIRVNQKLDGQKNSFNYEAMGWRMAERVKADPLAPGDKLDIAYTLTMNEHPEYGGLELTLQDFKRSALAAVAVYS
jgi:single-stranded-DNA-specific exonuclease